MNEIVLLFIFADFSNKMSKNLKRFAKLKMNGFLIRNTNSFYKKSIQKMLNIVRIVNYVVKTLTLNTRTELTLLVKSLVMLIKRHRKQKKSNLELIQSF